MLCPGARMCQEDRHAATHACIHASLRSLVTDYAIDTKNAADCATQHALFRILADLKSCQLKSMDKPSFLSALAAISLPSCRLGPNFRLRLDSWFPAVSGPCMLSCIRVSYCVIELKNLYSLGTFGIETKLPANVETA